MAENSGDSIASVVKRLEAAIERLLEKTDPPGNEESRSLEIDDRLYLELSEKSAFVMISDISHTCASGDYTEVFLANSKKYLVEKPLREWEQRLPQKHFMRIHRSTIINLNNIETIESLFNPNSAIEVHLVLKIDFRDTV